MQKISPFLWFDNNAEEALNSYLAIFKDAKVIRIARTPSGGPGPEGALLVATIQLEGQEITLMNGGPGHPPDRCLLAYDQLRIAGRSRSLLEQTPRGWRQDACLRLAARQIRCLLAGNTDHVGAAA